MKKLILTICFALPFFYSGIAQDEETVSSVESHVIHVAYSPSTNALIGFRGGVLGNSGGIITGGDLLESAGLYFSARYNNKNIMNLDRLSVDLGVSLQLVEFAYVFAGGGYGEYKYPYKEPTLLEDMEIKGVEIEGGAMIKVRKFTLHAGVSTLKFEHLGLFGGIGYTF